MNVCELPVGWVRRGRIESTYRQYQRGLVVRRNHDMEVNRPVWQIWREGAVLPETFRTAKEAVLYASCLGKESK